MNAADPDVTPRAQPVLPSPPAPSTRPKPSILLMLSADVNKRVTDAMKHLGDIMERVPSSITADEIRYALNDLAVAKVSAEAIAAECMKAVR